MCSGNAYNAASMEDGQSPAQRRAPATDWLKPPEEEAGLTRYLQTLRERIWIVVVAVVITTGIAVAYVLTASKTYDATANLLVSPVSGSSAGTPLVGLPGLIPASTDPTRDVQTASELVTNVDVATLVAKDLKSTETPRQLLDKVTAVPVATSNIVAVTASAGSPAEARDLANSFATQAVANQTTQLHDAIDRTLPALQSRLKAGVGDPTSLRTAIASLVTLRSGSDPSLSVETQADLPTHQASPRRARGAHGQADHRRRPDAGHRARGPGRSDRGPLPPQRGGRPQRARARALQLRRGAGRAGAGGG